MSGFKEFTPKKSLGQNFLVNPRVVERIIAACRLTRRNHVLEIGPGKGALTGLLSDKSKSVIAVEKDKILAEQLKQKFEHSNVTVINEDILKFTFTDIKPRATAIGNLPYNIATPIIERCIEHKDRISGLFMTVQLEYGQRLAAQTGTNHYGALSCFVQYHAEPKILFRIKNTSFRPVPKVQSCFMHLKLLERPRYQVSNEEKLFGIIRSCFGQRRKTIANSLAKSVRKDRIPAVLKSLGIDMKLRAENLSLKDYAGITNAVIGD